jgi:excinuclease ABC subunit A
MTRDLKKNVIDKDKSKPIKKTAEKKTARINISDNLIVVKGARTHNLKNININIPHQKLVVITGLSGSGKSSLAFDTLYAEGQRRYVESLSSYARQFLQMMDKPDVDSIDGLAPAISIEQKSASHNPRSTVGTVTEIHDYLRLLFARVGVPHCPTHHIPLQAKTVSQIVDEIMSMPENSKIAILAPVVQQKKGEFNQLFYDYIRQGYTKFRIQTGGGTKQKSAAIFYDEQDLPTLKRNEKHSIDIVVDRLKIDEKNKTRLAQSIEASVRLAHGTVTILNLDDHAEHIFNTTMACTHCDYSVAELEPKMFSFNSPAGACQACDGLGQVPLQTHVLLQHHSSNTSLRQMLEVIEQLQQDDLSEDEREEQMVTCEECGGGRLNLVARHVKIGDFHADHTLDAKNIVNVNDYSKTLPEINQLSLTEAIDFFKRVKFQGQKQAIAEKIIYEICQRLQFLIDVGLDYLSLSRSAHTLSGGEAQRIRLASQIGSGLCGVMYVLDEPSIGLHQSDNERLIKTLKHLKDLGNTVIVVEHDEDMMRQADEIIDMGLGAGVHGGTVIAQGLFDDICNHPESVTGQFLSKRREIKPNTAPKSFTNTLEIKGACLNNLKNVDVSFPIGVFTCITGVSGSGKSTLINETLYPLLRENVNRRLHAKKGICQSSSGFQHFDKVINIDQSPIGRTPRSNPATYTGLFTPIRELFAETQLAKQRGYKAGRFSFNVKGGRCEACQGDGVIKVEMHFLSDVYVNCDVCMGQRYNRETLEVLYKGKNISEVLAMTVEQATEFFSAIPTVYKKLKTLVDVGLSYITLGQAATTLSGGEAQRIKLALELAKRDTGRTFYILDEPTTGLHFHDIELLLQIVARLREHGNTIVMIEHNLDVIKTADYVIDIGPGGGKNGGEVVFSGTPQNLVKEKQSLTAQYLKPYFD